KADQLVASEVDEGHCFGTGPRIRDRSPEPEPCGVPSPSPRVAHFERLERSPNGFCGRDRLAVQMVGRHVHWDTPPIDRRPDHGIHELPEGAGIVSHGPESGSRVTIHCPESRSSSRRPRATPGAWGSERSWYEQRPGNSRMTVALMTLGDPLHSCAHRGHEGDGSFGARGDALTACVALSDPYWVRRHPPMRRTAQLAQGSQHRKISGIDAAYFEHVIRAHVHTFAFGLAAGMINDRSGSH